MELFDEIVECEVGMVTPHLPALIHFSLQVASNSLLGDNLRAKALSFLQWLASLKKKVCAMRGGRGVWDGRSEINTSSNCRKWFRNF